jgi:hygromycin-B 4-O-kinase
VKTDLAAQSVRATIEASMGVVSSFEPLAEGLDSQAFAFRFRGDGYVARVNRRPLGFHKDAFVARAFASTALPIPAVIAVDEIDGALWLCVSRRASGKPLHLIDDPAALAAAVLDVLDAIGAADVSGLTGYGRIDATGAGAHASWRDYLYLALDRQRYDWEAASTRPHRDLARRAQDALQRLAPAEAPVRGLIHGDFGTGNLIAEAGAITAVIDWDRAALGDPAYDAANLFYWGEARLAAVRARLLARHGHDPDWRRRILAYQLRIALEELYDAAVGRTPVDLDWLTRRCAEIVEASQAPGYNAP